MMIQINRYYNTYNHVDEAIKYFKEIFDAEQNENNKLFLEYLFNYLIKHQEKALASQFIYETLAKKKIFYDCSHMPFSIFKTLLSEIGNEKYFYFDRKIDSLLAEISVLNTLQNTYGVNIEDRKDDQGACDWIVQKNGEVFQVEVKQKESDDLFMRRVESFLKGFALLEEYQFLRGKWWQVKILIKRDDKSTDKIWNSLMSFVKNKKDCFEDENILAFTASASKNLELIKHCPNVFKYIQHLYMDKIFIEKDNEKIFEIMKSHLEKLKKKKKKYESDSFISAFVLHANFYDQIRNDLTDFIEQQVEKYDLKPFLLLIYSTMENTKSCFFNKP